MRRSGVLVLCIALGLHFSNICNAAPIVRTVVLSGDPVPGVSGATFSDFSAVSANFRLLDAGRAAFGAKLAVGPGGVTAGSDSGLWLEKDSGLNLVLREGWQAPGATAGAVFDEIGRGSWNTSGQFAIATALVRNVGGVTTNNDRGIWSNVGGSLQLFAREGNRAVGASVFDDIQYDDDFVAPTISDSGDLAFKGNLKAPVGSGDVTASTNEAIWYTRGGELVLRVREGNQARGAPTGALYGGNNIDLFNFSSPNLDASGRIAFTGYMVPGQGGVTSEDNTAFWSERNGTLQMIYREDMQAPGTAPGVRFFNLFEFPSINSHGHYAGEHILRGTDVTGENRSAVYKDTSGTLMEVARTGQQAPGAEPGTVFSSLNVAGFNDLGQIALSVGLRNEADDLPATTNGGFWTDVTGSLQLVVREGDAAPGAGPGAIFELFSQSSSSGHLNNVGQLAITGHLLHGFGGVTEANDTGYWAQDIGGNLHLIVREGDMLTVAPGDVRTIATLGRNIPGFDSNPSGLQFDDLGNLMFLANFTDGSQGLFIAAVPVPEPMTSVVLLFAFVTAACRLRVRRTLA